MCGRIISLIGNPDAYEIRKRFIDSDLNRVFDKRSDIENREIKRAQEIKKFFDGIKIDYIFDIHSTSTRSDPMILCTSQEGSKELAKKMPIKKVVHGLIDIVEGE